MSDLLVLAFLACATVMGSERCERITIPWDRSLLACMLQGQAEMARWFSQHPSYRLRGGWRCERGRDA
jgi:hypothetical protein